MSKDLFVKQITFFDVDDIPTFLRYGSRFVIVASQTLRESLLIPRTIDANNIELNIAVYCILERLGRARFNGELTHGKFSLQDIGGDPIAFHHSK